MRSFSRRMLLSLTNARPAFPILNPRREQLRGLSPRAFALGFLQTPPRDDALALSLPFGFSYAWRGDFHPASYVPCPAHT